MLVIMATTWYVVKRQGLLLQRTDARLTEHIVVMRLSATIGMAIGMITTYADLFALITLLAWTVFSPAIVAGWTGTATTEVTLADYLVLAGFLSALGIAVGALGASFERQHHVRHVTLVDEET